MSGVNQADLFRQRKWVAAFNGEAPRSLAEIIDLSNDKGRRLVLCFDGTGNQFSKTNSNVLRFFKCLSKDESNQLVYYQTGLGTYTSPAFVTRPGVEISMALDAAIGWNIADHVKDAYRFVMQNYLPGDKISLFGFSRGAYTARVLCGFIQKIGLLPPENHAQIPFAWDVFKRSDDKDGLQGCIDYKNAFSVTVKIDFVGLWDTVASLGISGRELPFARPMADGGVRVFRHAVALDERRAKFTPNFKLTLDGADKGRGIKGLGAGRLQLDRIVREVWFAGCHCDVGGGSVRDTERHTLARIPLRWMIRECFRMDTGILFDQQMLFDIGFRKVPFSFGAPLNHKTGPNDPHDSDGKETYLPILLLFLWSLLVELVLVFVRIFAYPINLIRYIKPFRRVFSRTKLKDLEAGSGNTNRTTDPSIQNKDTGPPSKEAVETKDEVAKPTDLEMGSGNTNRTSDQAIQNKDAGPPSKEAVETKDEVAKPTDLEMGSGNTNRTSDQAIQNKDAEPLSERAVEKKDAVSPINDELSRRWLWWLFEIWPLIFRVQDSKGGSRDEFETRINFGNGRKIYGDAWNTITVEDGATGETKRYIEVHKSVRQRMMKNQGYKPRAWLSVSGEGTDIIRWGDDVKKFEDSDEGQLIKWVD